MSMISQINNPESGIQQAFEEFYNGTGAALAHGDVLVRDLSTNAIAKGTYTGATTTTEFDVHVLGVVFDPLGQGVAAGARGVVMKKGYHSSVARESDATTVSIGTVMGTFTAAKQVEAFTAGATVLPGSVVGYLAKAITAAGATCELIVDVK